MSVEPGYIPPPPAGYQPQQQPLPPQAWGTAPPPRRGMGRWIAITMVVVFVLFAAAGGGAFFASTSLSQTYSPQQAVLNYFAAQQRGDVNTMLADANFTRGDGSYEQFFNKGALAAMLTLDQNKQISNLKIDSTRELNSSTAEVDTSMSWGGTSYTHAYVVHKDLADTHYFFYNSWKIDVPYSTIPFETPRQPGQVAVDGILLPNNDATSVQVVAGFHTLSMEESAFYDREAQTVNALLSPLIISFSDKISSTANVAVGAAIRAGAKVCNAAKYLCPNHTYYAPVRAGYIYYLDLPGHPQVYYKSYILRLSGDMTKGMTLDVTNDQSWLYAKGTCTSTMTVSGYGNKTFKFKGTWSADVQWNGSAFKATVYTDCADKAA
jgi:hypothetical protein